MQRDVCGKHTAGEQPHDLLTFASRLPEGLTAPGERPAGSISCMHRASNLSYYFNDFMSPISPPLGEQRGAKKGGGQDGEREKGITWTPPSHCWWKRKHSWDVSAAHGGHTWLSQSTTHRITFKLRRPEAPVQKRPGGLCAGSHEHTPQLLYVRGSLGDTTVPHNATKSFLLSSVALGKCLEVKCAIISQRTYSAWVNVIQSAAGSNRGAKEPLSEGSNCFVSPLPKK